MSKVIAAIDRRTESQSVPAMGRAVAAALDASLEILRFVDGDEVQIAAAEAGDSPARTLSGDRVELLAREATEEDVVAVVVGGPSTTEGSGLPPGHLAVTLAGRTDKPVVVVPPGFRPPEYLHTVVVAMEGTPGKARVLQRSIALSALAGLEIVVVHVEDEDSIPSFSDQVQHESEAYAQEFFARHLLGAPQMRLELRIGDPADEVLNAIESTGAELVAVGWPSADDPSHGAVAREIVERSPVPVLLMAIRVEARPVP